MEKKQPEKRKESLLDEISFSEILQEQIESNWKNFPLSLQTPVTKVRKYFTDKDLDNKTRYHLIRLNNF